MMQIVNLAANDVLLGRGTGPNEHCGNRAFRAFSFELVKMANSEPSGVSKNELARNLVDFVHSKNGRFVQRLSRDEIKDLVRMAFGRYGKKFWKQRNLYVIVPEHVAFDKAKQSIRHQQSRWLEREGHENANQRGKEASTTPLLDCLLRAASPRKDTASGQTFVNVKSCTPEQSCFNAGDRPTSATHATENLSSVLASMTKLSSPVHMPPQGNRPSSPSRTTRTGLACLDPMLDASLGCTLRRKEAAPTKYPGWLKSQGLMKVNRQGFCGSEKPHVHTMLDSAFAPLHREDLLLRPKVTPFHSSVDSLVNEWTIKQRIQSTFAAAATSITDFPQGMWPYN